MAGRVLHGARPESKPYLSLQEENKLVDFLVTCSNIGKTRGDVLKIAQAVTKKRD